MLGHRATSKEPVHGEGKHMRHVRNCYSLTLLTLLCPNPLRALAVGGSCVIGAGIGAATGPCRSRLRLLSRLAVGVGAKLPIGGSRDVSARGVC